MQQRSKQHQATYITTLSTKYCFSVNAVSTMFTSQHTMCAKHETRVILNIFKTCTAVCVLQWNLACDILMALAIKRIRNLPPHLSSVSTLPDITQKLKRHNDDLKHWHLRPYSSGIIDKAIDQWQIRLRACVKAKGRHFEHLYCDLDMHTAQAILFRATHTIERKTT